MNTVTDTLRQLIRLRDTIDLAIEAIHHSLTGEYSISSDEITQIIDDINTAWLDFDLNMVPDARVDADMILSMLGLAPAIESVPERSRGAFTVIDGGRA